MVSASLIHARHVLHNLRACDPRHNNEHVADIPQALEALYGEILGLQVAPSSLGLTLRPAPIRPPFQAALSALRRLCVTYPVEMEFPSSLLPGPNLVGAFLIPEGASRMLMRESQKETRLGFAARPSYNATRACNTEGDPPSTWHSRENDCSNLVHADQVRRRQ